MNKWFWILGMLWLAGCGTDSDDGLTDDERRSKEIWNVVTTADGLWASYNPIPENFTVFSDSQLVQEFLDINSLSSYLSVRDIARPEVGGKRFKSIRVNLDTAKMISDTLAIPASWSQLELTQLYVHGGLIKKIEGLGNLKKLFELSLTGTAITSIPDEILKFDLGWLSLFSNNISQLPEWVIDYVDSNRTILWINNNQIQKMPENLIQKHWQIRISGNLICNISAEDSIAIHELSISGTGGYIQQGEYLSNPALGFFPQNCD